METESLGAALSQFYRKNGFGADLGKRILVTVKVYTGCMLVPLPNIETRRKYLKYHDFHHLITRYSVGRIGEGKTSAWELGTGTFYHYPVLGIMNLIALSTGLFLEPKAMWKAFLSGKKSRNLYAKATRQLIDREEITLEELSRRTFFQREHKPTIFTQLEFGLYCGMAILIHGLLALPAVVLRAVSDWISTGSLIETVKPKKRSDLF